MQLATHGGKEGEEEEGGGGGFYSPGCFSSISSFHCFIKSSCLMTGDASSIESHKHAISLQDCVQINRKQRQLQRVEVRSGFVPQHSDGRGVDKHKILAHSAAGAWQTEAAGVESPSASIFQTKTKNTNRYICTYICVSVCVYIYTYVYI